VAVSASEKRLRDLYAALSEEDRRALLAFAEFLQARAADGAAEPEELPPPAQVPRPERETVVGALKRLSATYHMLDKSKMLSETSALMAQHVMQGREVVEVIEELEVVFRSHYERLRTKRGGPA
jgi:hypothetical protein